MDHGAHPDVSTIEAWKERFLDWLAIYLASENGEARSHGVTVT
jgi:hypothetical protein